MNRFLTAFIVFCLLLLTIVGVSNYSSHSNAEKLLAESASSHLTAICVAAREVISVNEFYNLKQKSDTVNNPDYAKTLQKLQHIATNAGAKYIYVLKKIGDEYQFIYDTDPEDPEVFIPYELSPVHVTAFNGKVASDIVNVTDQYGGFSTGAVPLWRGGQVVGIVCADVEDTLIKQYQRLARINTWLLVGTILATMVAMLLLMRHLLLRVKEMQDQLNVMARFDAVTGLPNRLHLLEYLESQCNRPEKVPFALCFIDLDNFKQVNDTAGHDAGDALLKRIGSYLAKSNTDTRRASRVFRPTPGKLNIAARVGGDEFVTVIHNIASAQEARVAAGEIVESFKREKIDDLIGKFNVGMSIGVSLFPSQSEDYNVLIKYADMAMYEAKHAGKNCCRVYSDDTPAKQEK